jgi:peptidoglycan-associated lipoprotein
MQTRRFASLLAVLLAAAALACGGKTPPVAKPTPPPQAFPSTGGGSGTVTPTPPPRPPEPPVIRSDSAITADPLTDKPVDWINDPANSPLKPVFFAYDSDELDEIARRTLDENAGVLRKYATWVITLEGHCDERGTAEYNLALGDRRALAAKNYLLSLGVPSERLRTVSYGKEFPFDPGHDEGAWAKNRRAHLMLTSK